MVKIAGISTSADTNRSMISLVNAPRTSSMRTSASSLFSDVSLESNRLRCMFDNFVNTPPELAVLVLWMDYSSFFFCLCLFILPILLPAIISLL